jgi:uncharacterized protein YecT (DUF1311 family)
VRSIALGLSVWTLSVASASAFDCAAPKWPWDIVVCSDAELQRLADQRLAAFEEAKTRISSAQVEQLRKEQAAWVHSYSAACGIPPNRRPPSPVPAEIIQCFMRAGEARLAYLQSYVPEDRNPPSRSEREGRQLSGPSVRPEGVSRRGEKTLDDWIACLHDGTIALVQQPEPAQTVADGVLGSCQVSEMAFFNATVKTGEIDRAGFERIKKAITRRLIARVLTIRAARAKLKQDAPMRPFDYKRM